MHIACCNSAAPIISFGGSFDCCVRRRVLFVCECVCVYVRSKRSNQDEQHKKGDGDDDENNKQNMHEIRRAEIQIETSAKVKSMLSRETLT